MHCGYLRFGPHSRPERTGQRADYPWGQRCLWRENGLRTALREGVLSPWNKDEETNLTVFDNTNCIGCHSCAMACPVQALRLVDMDAGDEADEEASLQKLGKEILEFQT